MNRMPFFSLSMCFDSSGSNSANAVALCTRFQKKKKGGRKAQKTIQNLEIKSNLWRKNSQYAVLNACVQLTLYYVLQELAFKQINSKNLVLQKMKAQWSSLDVSKPNTARESCGKWCIKHIALSSD